MGQHLPAPGFERELVVPRLVFRVGETDGKLGCTILPPFVGFELSNGLRETLLGVGASIRNFLRKR